MTDKVQIVSTCYTPNSISSIYVQWFLNYCTCTGRHRKEDRQTDREKERERETGAWTDKVVLICAP